MYQRPLEWAHSKGLSTHVLIAVLVTGFVVTVAAFLNNPIAGGAAAMITTIASLVMAWRQTAIDAAHELRKRWAAAVDPVTQLVQTPTDSVAALLRPEFEVVPYNNIHIEQVRDLHRWAQSPDALALRFLTGGAGAGKTRTARQLARRLQDGHGWQCGVARCGATTRAVTTDCRPPPAAVVASLRTMMRDIVTSGQGMPLARYGDLLRQDGLLVRAD
jgi:hypothetical protein